MVMANILAHKLTVCSELSLLRLSCSSSVHQQLLSSSRNEIISSAKIRSCSSIPLMSTVPARSGPVGLFVPRSGRASESWWSGGGLPSVNRRGIILGSISISWIAAGFAGAAATGAIAMAAMAGQGGRQQAMVATRKGMQLFSEGDVKGSLEKFDEALELDHESLPYLWQRGLSFYYVNRFEEGAKQFRDDVAVNPNDTEEAIWCFLCEAQYLGVDEARRRFLVVGPDRRPIMKEIYNLFRDGGSTEKLLQAVDSTEGADYFYANLYAGLYHEAHKRQDAAKDAILAAVNSYYGTGSGDYMAVLARVHAACRGWKASLDTLA
ncbi:unnamed protein product [Calypogeia fissa]